MAIIEQDGQPGKICTKCKTWKPLHRLIKRTALQDGYDSICSDCRNIASREWRKNNQERVAELNRQFYESHHEARKAYNRHYRQHHLEHLRALSRTYRRANSLYFRTYMRNWSRANPDKIKAKDHARRAYKMGQPGAFTAQQWHDLKVRYNHTCLRCKRQEPEIKLTADHVIPIIDLSINALYSAGEYGRLAPCQDSARTNPSIGAKVAASVPGNCTSRAGNRRTLRPPSASRKEL